MHNLLYKIITKSYEAEDILEELVESRTIAIPKIGITIECNN